jgi:hypothetical protein
VLVWFLFGTAAAQAKCVLVGEKLHAEWYFRDSESGPEGCEWGIGTSFGAQDVLAYTTIAHEAGYVSGAQAALPAVQGQYFVSLRMSNRVGLTTVHYVPHPLTVLSCAGEATCAWDVKCM